MITTERACKIIVCQVCGPTQTIYEGTEREFTDSEEARNYLFSSFKNMYGDEAAVDFEFWDPIEREDSSTLYSIEMFSPGQKDGWYLYHHYAPIH